MASINNVEQEGGSKWGRAFLVERWVVLLSSLLTTFLVYDFFRDAKYKLYSFTDRMIGQVVVANIDASARVNHYVMALVLCTVSFFSFVLLFGYLNKWLTLRVQSGWLSRKKQIVSELLLLGLFLIFMEIVTRQPHFMISLSLLRPFVVLLGLQMFLVALGRGHERLQALFSDSLTVAVIIDAASLVFLCKVFRGREAIILGQGSSALFWGLIAGGYGVLYWYLKRRDSLPSIESTMLIASLPVALIPLSIPAANELQFTISSLCHIHPAVLARCLVTLEVIIGIGLFFFCRRKDVVLRHPNHLVKYVYFPLVVVTFAAFKYYVHSLQVSSTTIDLFHKGELSVPVQQLYHFGKIPLVDYYPTHNISDMFRQLLYSLINGYRGAEIFLWEWVDFTIIITLYYFILPLLPVSHPSTPGNSLSFRKGRSDYR